MGNQSYLRLAWNIFYPALTVLAFRVDIILIDFVTKKKCAHVVGLNWIGGPIPESLLDILSTGATAIYRQDREIDFH